MKDYSYLQKKQQEYVAKRDSLTEQVCTKCNKSKPINEFGKRKLRSGIIGYLHQCKECRSINIIKFKERHPEYRKEFNKGETQLVCNYCNSEFKSLNPNQKYCSIECRRKAGLHPRIKLTPEQSKANRKAERKRYREQHIELFRAKRNANRKKEFERNPDKVRAKRNAYKQNRASIDVNFRLVEHLRKKVYLILRKNKSLHTIDLLGCSVDHARKHIEMQFKDGMTWDNWAMDGWHIDHIIPISSFDLTDIEQQKQCCHYTNLQPLWSDENYKKSNKIIERQLICL